MRAKVSVTITADVWINRGLDTTKTVQEIKLEAERTACELMENGLRKAQPVDYHRDHLGPSLSEQKVEARATQITLSEV